MKDVFQFVPYRLDMMKLFDSNGIPYAYEQFAERVFVEMETDEKLMDKVYFSVPEFGIHLDNEGIAMLNHIMVDYFDIRDINDLMKYIYNKNCYEQTQTLIKNLTSHIPTGVINRNIRAAEEVIQTSDETEGRKKIAEDLLTYLHDELNRRKGEIPFINFVRCIKYKIENKLNDVNIMDLIPSGEV